MDDKVYEQFRELLLNFLKLRQAQNILDCPTISATTDLVEDLGIDSLEMFDLVQIIEKEFGVKVVLKEVVTKRKVAEVVDYIVDLRLPQGNK